MGISTKVSEGTGPKEELSTSIISTVDDLQKSNTISVRPYFESGISNMGLEKYGLSLYEGVYHYEQLALVERGGVKRYLTGLNEFAPEIKLIPDTEKREAKIKEIRKIVSQLEKDLASNIIDVNDPDFWNKVVLLKPNNDEFWGKIDIRCGNQPLNLDPTKDPYDLIKICAIEAGGFSMIAPSYEAAKDASVSPKFYLDKLIDTISTKTEITKLKNRALSELQKLFDKNQNKLFYVAKAVDASSPQYKKTTPNDIIYDNMDKFITGRGVDPSIKRSSQTFLDACNMDMETLKIKSIVKDCTFYKFIALKSDGFIYHVDSGALLGRSVADCIEYLKNPLNDSVLMDLTKKIEKYWNK